MQSRDNGLKIKDVLRSDSDTQSEIITSGNELSFEIDDEVSAIDCIPDYQLLPVEYVEVNTVEIATIHDVYGRLSDVITGLIAQTGVSVIPLEMTSISPEVVDLKDYELFALAGRRYAMAKDVRADSVKAFEDRIIKTLETGLAFNESLKTLVTYEGKDYRTLALSKAEWTYIMSRFRKYKEKLYVTRDGNLVLEIIAEHV